jgi:hypothetical protein
MYFIFCLSQFSAHSAFQKTFTCLNKLDCRGSFWCSSCLVQIKLQNRTEKTNTAIMRNETNGEHKGILEFLMTGQIVSWARTLSNQNLFLLAFVESLLKGISWNWIAHQINIFEFTACFTKCFTTAQWPILLSRCFCGSKEYETQPWVMKKYT